MQLRKRKKEMKMKKTLYSLMLSDDVIREIDQLAHRMGTNRSNLVNQILAEHVQLRTPEQRVSDIFSAIEELMSSSQIVPLVTQGSPNMALRSCLEYKYRPTVRYEVELFPAVRDGVIGSLSVVFRTQSAALLEALTGFFRLWAKIEDKYLGIGVRYMLDGGRFTRTLMYPTSKGSARDELSSKELAEVISDYIRLFDRLLKAYVAGNLTPDELASQYAAYLKTQNILI